MALKRKVSNICTKTFQISELDFKPHLAASIDVQKSGVRQPLLCQFPNRRANVVQSFGDESPQLKVHEIVNGLDGEGPTPENLVCWVSGSKLRLEPLVTESSHMVEIWGSFDPVLIPFNRSCRLQLFIIKT